MRPKSKKDTGLGKAIIRDRFKGNTRPKDGDTFLVFIITILIHILKLRHKIHSIASIKNSIPQI
jgi:hypothetical protein